MFVGADNSDGAARLQTLRVQSDDLSREVRRALDRSAIAPLPHDALHVLRAALHRFTGAVLTTTDRLLMFGLPSGNPEMDALTDLVKRETAAMEALIESLLVWPGRSAFLESWRELGRMDIEGSSLLDSALTRLYHTPNPDPITALKWRDVYEQLERGLDAGHRFLIGTDDVLRFCT